MKIIPLVLTFLFLKLPLSHGQIIVHDPGNAQVALANHAEEILKLLEAIKELQSMKDWLGHAADIVDLAGLDSVFANLQSEGKGRSRVDIAAASTSAEGTAYTGDGLYQSVGDSFATRDGQTVARPDAFKPQAAIFNAVHDHDVVYEDVMARRKALRQGIEQTVSQLQNATTHVEVMKTTGVLMAQQAEMDATDHELQFATEKAILIDLQNRADKERQEKAAAQEQTRELTEALNHFGQALRPGVFTTSTKPSL